MAATLPKQAELVPSEPARTPATHRSDLMTMIAQIVANPQANIDALERLIALKERMDARSAEESFNAAMTDAQEEMRPISADAENPSTKSRYASYAQLDMATRPVYTKHGFGISYDTAESPLSDHVRVLAYATHRAGHSRTYKLDMPNDGKGAKGGDVMTKTHAQGAAMSYGMRYLLKMIFNIAVGEDDRDGNEVRPKSNGTAQPDGYDEWLTNMSERASEGWPVLQAAYNKSPEKYRTFLSAYQTNVFEKMKQRAREVSKGGAR